MPVLQQGSTGPEVADLQNKLRSRGFDPGASDGSFGPGTAAAVAAFQRSAGLTADGVVGPQTAAALGLVAPAPVVSAIPAVTVAMVCQIFPNTPAPNIQENLPVVLNALVTPQLTNKAMILMALGTIRAETESFLPISEGQSPYNTSPGGHPFDLYDSRADLGNQGPPDGERFKGRGFIQLTGRTNYQVHGNAIGLGNQLIENPDLANDPTIAAQLLASFLKSREQSITAALAKGDLATARRLVNGGSNGIDRFTDAYNIGKSLLPDSISA
ncbi:MAG: peptidoglycan-binding protein [Bryobacteraceae bacterium]|jgi:peptidoglycan L-alanyl-D-glutamate endopeptidase CwlK